ncbi:hypothetical protein [Aeromonas sobria]|uniref:hypothetical protein n=1 Tax=Aeromonas sobria TaxID=646 RepID=UPI003F36B44A
MNDVCLHQNEVVDEHEGIIVCLDCSHVIDNYLFHDAKIAESPINNQVGKDALEILQRLNLPEEILYHSKDLKTIANLYNLINLQSVVTVKEFCAASGISEKNVVKANKEKVCQTSMDTLVEKYCGILNLNYRDCTLIKENILNRPYSGHPPLTVLAYELYMYIREVKKSKTTIKNICKELGISSISIQRYKKYVLSHRC